MKSLEKAKPIVRNTGPKPPIWIEGRVDLRQFIISATITFPVPVSEMKDFQFYHEEMSRNDWHKTSWPDPIRGSIKSYSSSEISKVKDGSKFNKPSAKGVRSPQKRLGILRKLVSSEHVQDISVIVDSELWKSVLAIAEHYGITTAEHCLLCLSYHAALGRRMREKLRPKSPFDRFEEKLKFSSRQLASA